ncbi:MAG: ROK family protein, partial [Thermoleophilia bacterium]|nr:ROK family protein [Thermoleophilia bacterium]
MKTTDGGTKTRGIDVAGAASGEDVSGTILGVDIGGTKIAVAPVDATGTLAAPPVVRPSGGWEVDTETFVSSLIAVLREAKTVFAEHNPQAIGLACAGTVDPVRGVVVVSPNLPLHHTPLAHEVEQALKLPVVLENDANAAVLAEAVAGAAKGKRQVVMLALGTGVGGGLFLDGRVYHGAGGGAGELGHTIVRAGGE